MQPRASACIDTVGAWIEVTITAVRSFIGECRFGAAAIDYRNTGLNRSGMSECCRCFSLSHLPPFLCYDGSGRWMGAAGGTFFATRTPLMYRPHYFCAETATDT